MELEETHSSPKNRGTGNPNPSILNIEWGLSHSVEQYATTVSLQSQ